jgi:hypothetical protein
VRLSVTATVPLDELADYDAIIFGTPTRFGNMCAQMRNFLDQTGGHWMKGTLVGKVGSVFTSTATQHGGQETTITSFHSTLLHQGSGKSSPCGALVRRFSTPLFLMLRLITRQKVCAVSFRHSAGSLWSLYDPANVRGLKDLLGHVSFAPTEKHYIMGQSRIAGRALAHAIDRPRE